MSRTESAREFSVRVLPEDRCVDVGMIYCVGRNYALHAKEMGSEVPTEPVIFTKPKTALVSSGSVVQLPAFSSDVHFETELVYQIDQRLCKVGPDEALGAISAVGIGLDLTMRDRQAEAKRGGKPWAVAKGFDQSAPVGSLVSVGGIDDLSTLRFSLSINGEQRQRGAAESMIFAPDFVLSWLSSIFTLLPGDLLFSGTPDGVGPLSHGDSLHASIEGLSDADLRVSIARES